MPRIPRLLDVRTGHARRVAGHLTAYGKESRAGPVRVNALSLDGDEVGNPRVHGGPDKAVYAYAASAYPLWAAEHPAHAATLVPGAFGENLLVDGLDETGVCVGDRWRTGRALLEVCQPRQPCVTLARRFGDPAMVKAMVKNGRSGWYLAVAEEGLLAAGDPLLLERRLPGAWSIARVLEASYRSPPLADELSELAGQPALAQDWAAWARRAAGAARPRPKPL